LIDFQIAGFAVLFAAPTAILGGYVSHFLPGSWLLALVGVVRETTEAANGVSQAGAAPRAKKHTDRKGRTCRYRVRNDFWRGSAAGFGGVLQGLVGFSAGELSTVEQILRGIPVQIAAGNSPLIIAAASILRRWRI